MTPTSTTLVPEPISGANPLLRHLVSQFERPRGPLGSLAGLIMSRRTSNVERNRRLIELCDLAPHHRVLELGPGPGVALAAAAERVTTGRLVAVDHSDRMLAQTAARNRQLLRDGRLTLIRRDVSELPADLVDFDRIWAMNVWQFWPDQERTVADLAARLRPGGLLVIGYQPRHRGASAADADAARRCLRDQLVDAGLAVDDRVADLDPPAVYVLGRR
jgi:SAM-dependent methyltransferase